eukprot:766526-Hanusia_phi.AAC.1
MENVEDDDDEQEAGADRDEIQGAQVNNKLLTSSRFRHRSWRYSSPHCVHDQTLMQAEEDQGKTREKEAEAGGAGKLGGNGGMGRGRGEGRRKSKGTSKGTRFLLENLRIFSMRS